MSFVAVQPSSHSAIEPSIQRARVRSVQTLHQNRIWGAFSASPAASARRGISVTLAQRPVSGAPLGCGPGRGSSRSAFSESDSSEKRTYTIIETTDRDKPLPGDLHGRRPRLNEMFRPVRRDLSSGHSSVPTAFDARDRLWIVLIAVLPPAEPGAFDRFFKDFDPSAGLDAPS